MLISILLNSALWWGAALLTAGRFRDPVTRVLAALVVGFTAIVVATELLSLGGLFHRVPVAVVCGLLPLAGFALTRIRRGSDPRKDAGRIDEADAGQTRPVLMALCWLVLVAAGLMAIDNLLYGLWNPVQVDSDAPIYHLPFALHWAQVGRLEMIPTPFGEEGAPYFPANGDLWLSWLAVTSGGAAFIKVGQWPFLAAGGLALSALARQSDASRTASAIVGGLWCMLPLVLRQASLANVDLIWTACYFVALHFVIRFCHARVLDRASLRDLALAALAMGLVLGTKSLGLLFVPLLWLPLARTIWRPPPVAEIGSTGSFRLSALVVLVTVLLVPSLCWYARNTWLTGNPLYPLDVSPGGLTVFAGMFDGAAMRRTAYHVPVAEWTFLPARLRYVCGPVLVTLWAIGLFAGLFVTRGNDGTRPRSTNRLLSLLAAGHVALFWFVLPYNTQERFLMPALGLGLVPLARTLTLWPILGWPALALVLLHCGLALGAGPAVMEITSFRVLRGESLSELRWWGAGVCGWLSLATVLRGAGRSMYARLSPVIPVAALIVACGCLYAGPIERIACSSAANRFYPETGFGARMRPAWRVVEQFTSDRGIRIAYAGGNLPYYLRGSQLQNEVCYVNVNEHRRWLPHDYHRARLVSGRVEKAVIPWPQWDREQTDYDAWLANLRDAGVELLFVSRVNLHGRIVDLHGELPPFPIERTWADEHPDMFEDLGPPETGGAIPWARVYRVRAETATGGVPIP